MDNFFSEATELIVTKFYLQSLGSWREWKLVQVDMSVKEEKKSLSLELTRGWSWNFAGNIMDASLLSFI